MVWFLSLIIILIIIAGGIWWTQRSFAQRIQNLDARVAAIDSGALASQVRGIEQLHLTGESLASFDRWQKAYNEMMANDLAALSKALLDVEEANRRYRFAHVRHEIKTITTQVDQTQARYQEIQAGLEMIRHDEADNRSRLLTLHDEYQDLRKTILAKSFVFGDAQPALEQQLLTLESAFTQIDQLNGEGDHEAAKAQIQALADDVAALKYHVDELPNLVNEQTNEFPAQLSEIDHGYRQLTTAHFVFTEDIPAQLKVVQEKLDAANTTLKHLDVAQITAENQAIEVAIDALYATMEKEMQARKQVETARGDLRQFIAHAQQQNTSLQQELDHLDQSYTLNHGEMKAAKQLQTQLNGIATNFARDEEAIEAGEAVFSDVAERYAAIKDQLMGIEKSQRAIAQSVTGLKTDEVKANREARRFEMDMRNIKHEMMGHHLPGLPQSYLDDVRHANAMITALDHDLNQVKIDMDDISKSIIAIQHEVDALKDKTDALIDAAGMTEQLLQYANRYRIQDDTVGVAVGKAQERYDHFDYQSAADIIATALEATEPGSYKKVEDAYLEQKHSSLY